MHFVPPAKLSVSGPSGPGAMPTQMIADGASAEQIAGLIEATLMECVRHLLAATNEEVFTEDSVVEFARRLLPFLEFLFDVQLSPAEAISEPDLRLYLYDKVPWRVAGDVAEAEEIVMVLRQFFSYLGEHKGVLCPWAAPVLADNASLIQRVTSFPGEDAPMDDLVEWTAVVVANFSDNVWVPDTIGDDDGDDESSAQPGPMEQKLYHLLSRRWMHWRDQLIENGVTDPDQLYEQLVATQRRWEVAPIERLGGAPLELVQRERSRQ